MCCCHKFQYFYKPHVLCQPDISSSNIDCSSSTSLPDKRLITFSKEIRFIKILFPHKPTVRYSNQAVHEHLVQAFFYLLSGDAFFQDDLKEATAAGTADEFSDDQFFDAAENLLDQCVAASGIDFFAQFPVVIQKAGEAVYIATFQFKTHQRCCLLDLFQGKKALRLVSDIASDNITEQVTGKSSLACVDQNKSVT